MQEIVSGAVLSRAFVRIKSYREPCPSLKAHTIADFAIEPYASPRPNSRGENLNLRYNLAKRSVELLLRVRDEI
nr:hypothetical protein [uncultured Campylobacter sp.]